MTPTPEPTAEHEALASLFDQHKPVTALDNGYGTHIVGCQCMDRVYFRQVESYADHLADVLAAHDAQVTEKALRDAAREIDFEWEVFVAGDGRNSIRQHGKSPETLLNERADRLSKETPNA